MTEISRHLITTPDERTWKFDQPVIFLGKWCQLYNRRHIWEKMDFVTAEPYGFDPIQRGVDEKMCRNTENELISILTSILNKFHGVSHSQRYWRILCGHWLRGYVDLIFNRYTTLQLSMEEYNISSMSYFEDKNFSLVTPDTRSFHLSCDGDVWNSILYSKILMFCDSESIDKLPIEINGLGWVTKPTSQKKTFTQHVIKYIKQTIYSFLRIFSKESDAIITNTYLPYFDELKLKFMFKQVPAIYDHPSPCYSEPDLILRKNLSSAILDDDNKGYSSCVKKLIFDLMPTCFLEDYQMMSKIVDELKWPKKPKFIFTSNSYYFDEVFKFMTAKQVESGTPYYVGQHGLFGIYNYNYPTVEMLTCDKYLRWGSETSIPQEVPAFILAQANKNIVQDKDGGLLFIQEDQGHRIEMWDNTHRYFLCMNNNYLFYNSLDKKIAKSTFIRLHTARFYFRQYESERWLDVDNNINITDDSHSYDYLLAKNRIVVFSYNSSGFFTNLSQNIPSLLLIGDTSFIRDEVLPDYKPLIENGIVHLSSGSAAETINSVWDDIDTWWMSFKVQNARKLFCEKYARQSISPITELVEILK